MLGKDRSQSLELSAFFFHTSSVLTSHDQQKGLETCSKYILGSNIAYKFINNVIL